MSLSSIFKQNMEIGNNEIPNVIFKADESLIADLIEDIEAQDNELISGNSLDNPEQMTREEAEYFTKKYTSDFPSKLVLNFQLTFYYYFFNL